MTLDTFTTHINAYQFSGQNIDSVGATELTLVTIAIDKSYSVKDFKNEIEKCVQEIIKTLSSTGNPRRHNLMLRVLTFNDYIVEVHGFKSLLTCKPEDYIDFINPSGGTSLFEATDNAIESVLQYGEQLLKKDYIANAIVFVITDGMDTSRWGSPTLIGDKIKESCLKEKLESILTILIGVNVNDSYVIDVLNKFKSDARFDHFKDIKNADKKSMSDLVGFVSQNIVAQSQKLGTGGPSQIITF